MRTRAARNSSARGIAARAELLPQPDGRDRCLGGSGRLRDGLEGQPQPVPAEAQARLCAAVRSCLFPLIQQVNDDHEPVRMNSCSGDAVLMSADDFDSWQETICLLRSPASARHLMVAVVRDKSGRGGGAKTVDELEGLAGE
jgi:antitoxin YefM